MLNLNKISAKIKAKQYEFSKHALDQSIIRGIRTSEVKYAFSTSSQLVEDYPNDKYGPSCLLLGYTIDNKAIHIHCSYPERDLIKIITLYYPDPSIWINDRIRKVKQEP